MKILRALLVTCLLGTGIVACDDSSFVAPQSPSFNGYTIGGGHRSDTTSISPIPATEDGTTTDRGGSTFGGGN